MRIKSFLAGFLAGIAVLALAAYVVSNLRDTAIASKSKRHFVDAHYLDGVIQDYHDATGAWPPSKKHVVDAQRRNQPLVDFDYFVQDGHYTLIHPSLTGTLRSAPYVFQDGRLVAFPSYMDEEMARMGIHRGSRLSRRVHE